MKVLTMGTFAVPHIGHAAFLQRCEAFGELVVGVNSDAFAERYRGERPLFSESERMVMIASLGYRVVLNDGPGRDLVEREWPDIIVVGTDWATRDYLGQIDCPQEFLDAHRITVAYVPMRPIGISSREIIRRTREGVH
jgi:glycerol-3-phosphate cytidylyltransferase